MTLQAGEIGMDVRTRPARRTVNDELADLADALNYAEDRYERLRILLEPVLCEDAATVAGLAEAPDRMREGSTIAHQVMLARTRLQSIGHRLDALGDRVDL